MIFSVRPLAWLLTFLVLCTDLISPMSWLRKEQLRDKVKGMFLHAYGSYIKHAWPADELQPISCKGRFRSHGSGRGDIDDAMGNYSLTLVDTLDTLFLLNETEEFERAVRLVIQTVRFDRDVVVSVFETTIRMLGGLLSAHVLAQELQVRTGQMMWYQHELLDLSLELGYALLPAFESSTGVPYPRVNLKLGMREGLADQRHTCAACAGTMILEFASLSRLSGDPIFEQKARTAMDYLWHKRHIDSHLLGHIIDVHSGDWIRRESGIGAGSDSYYEYVLKAYILLGDETYLQRFQRHYGAILKYVMHGARMQDVLMHQPTANSKPYLDALIAFFPGLQVLYGDIGPAKASYDTLHKVVKRYNFLPEAFTPEPELRMYWSESYLRPEFIESTYFLFQATRDPLYLRVGEHLVDSLESLSRVECGYAAFKDTKAGVHDDRMDSFFLAETLKYLYLLFTEPRDLLIDIDEYVFTTEAHILPLHLARKNVTHYPHQNLELRNTGEMPNSACPNSHMDFQSLWHWQPKVVVEEEYASPQCQQVPKYQIDQVNLNQRRIVGREIDWSNENHIWFILEEVVLPVAMLTVFICCQVLLLAEMGISLVRKTDGTLLISHDINRAKSMGNVAEGMVVMQELVEASRRELNVDIAAPGEIRLFSAVGDFEKVLPAAPAQFGDQLKSEFSGMIGFAEPETACVANVQNVSGKIALVKRGGCMFIEKARNVQESGAVGMIVADVRHGSSFAAGSNFAMSGDNGNTSVSIPALFLYFEEAQSLVEAYVQYDDLVVTMRR